MWALPRLAIVVIFLNKNYSIFNQYSICNIQDNTTLDIKASLKQIESVVETLSQSGKYYTGHKCYIGL